MSDSIDAVLRQAYDLIEAGQPAEAKNLLEPLLHTHEDNPDLWWIYSYAVPDPAAARRALNRVIALEPQYPGANEMRQMLDERYPAVVAVPAPGERSAEAPALAATPAEGEARPTIRPLGAGVPPTPPQDLPEPPDFPEPIDFDQAPRRAAAPTRRRSPLPLFLGVILLISLVIVGAVLLSQGGAGSTGDVPTAVVVGVTETSNTDIAVVGAEDATVEAVADATEAVPLVLATDVTPEVSPIEPEVTIEAETTEAAATDAETPTLQPEPEATEAAPTAAEVEATATDVQPTLVETEAATAEVEPTLALEVTTTALDLDVVAIEDAMQFFAVPRNAVVEAETGFGNTVIVTVCSAPGPEVRSTMPRALTTLAQISPQLPPERIEGVAVRMLDCATQQTLILMGAPLTAALEFAAGTIDATAFQATWRPQ